MLTHISLTTKFTSRGASDWLSVSVEFETHQRIMLFLKHFFLYCLVLVGSRSGFERDLRKLKCSFHNIATYIIIHSKVFLCVVCVTIVDNIVYHHFISG